MRHHCRLDAYESVLALDKLGHQCRQAIELILCPAILDHDIAAIDEPGFASPHEMPRPDGRVHRRSRHGETRPRASPAAVRAPLNAISRNRALLDQICPRGLD
jgi:hypothetical protein